MHEAVIRQIGELLMHEHAEAHAGATKRSLLMLSPPFVLLTPQAAPVLTGCAQCPYHARASYVHTNPASQSAAGRGMFHYLRQTARSVHVNGPCQDVRNAGAGQGPPQVLLPQSCSPPSPDIPPQQLYMTAHQYTKQYMID